MSSDPLTALIRSLNQSMLGIAALGGALRLRQAGLRADPGVASALDGVLDRIGAPPLDSMSADQTQQALGLIRTFFVEAEDLLDNPERPPGWTFDDPAILQGIGASSAGMVGRMSALAATRPWFADLLARRGTFLDIGTGVGGIALAAAQAWPGMAVEGIDCWPPSLALAHRNLADNPCDRVTFHARALEDLDGPDGRYDLVWLPTPFIARTAVTDAIPRLLPAVAPGGGLVVGVIPPATDPLAAALGQLRTVRNGGHCWPCAEMAVLLADAGFVDVEVPPDQAGMHFVLGRRPH